MGSAMLGGNPENITIERSSQAAKPPCAAPDSHLSATRKTSQLPPSPITPTGAALVGLAET